MKGTISLPEGLALPENANTQPFSLTGKFLLRGDKLLPLELGGIAIPCDEDSEHEGEEYEEEEYENKEPDGCCGSYKHGDMCDDCPKKGGGFLIAVERAMGPAKVS